MTKTILHIDASARLAGSTTRQLTSRIVEKLGGDVIRRDLTDALPQINEAWVNANFTPADQRSEAQEQALALSDALVDEIKAADVIVIGAPVYNFGVPAALKAWIDLIVRAGLTFAYTENGPKGLLEGKRAVIALATGGTSVGSEIDFASGYLRHIMGFIGISDVDIIAADRVMADAEKAVTGAHAQIDALAA
ncbi:NAD(P)H-dependent oxidoreductase [uncultured Roseobacter sp.]|uniref:FMN-dependent NADH-azoreductase n=1 Tax=uncultured Roseobacter sp. TaxID=114847 RepID=UPI002633BB8B|nr:NAD(P)H-dependent oxidoreductase [uncultured Roseobacter sp.]